MFTLNLFNINEVTNSFQNIDNIIYKCYDSLILLKDFIKKISKYICILLIFYINISNKEIISQIIQKYLL